jgi:nicotinate-nucleotide--dimethylbenzimidazole phosphoribosyltransferase
VEEALVAITPETTAANSPRCDWKAVAKERLDSLTKPVGSLGRLEEIAAKVACIQQREQPRCERKVAYVFAADHGVTEEKVSAYPKAVTEQMVRNFLANGAAINVLARCAGAEVVVVDVGVDADIESHPRLVQKKIIRGTRNMAMEPAMSEAEMHAALDVGSSLLGESPARKNQVIAVGEMGIGNTTAAAAVTAALTGRPVEEVTGLGTGISSEMLRHKQQVIERALELHNLKNAEPLGVLRTVGGLEIAAMTGMILAARGRGIAVVIDGFISTAAAALAYANDPTVVEIIFAGHLSQEGGHRVLLEYIGLDPILDLRMRLGEGTGAVLAMTVIEAAVAIFNEMATFSSAGVSGPQA